MTLRALRLFLTSGFLTLEEILRTGECTDRRVDRSVVRTVPKPNLAEGIGAAVSPQVGSGTEPWSF